MDVARAASASADGESYEEEEEIIEESIPTLPDVLVRRADLDDAYAVAALLQAVQQGPPNTEATTAGSDPVRSFPHFGLQSTSSDSIAKTIETAFLSVVAEDKEGHMVGFCSLEEKPPVLGAGYLASEDEFDDSEERRLGRLQQLSQWERLYSEWVDEDNVEEGPEVRVKSKKDDEDDARPPLPKSRTVPTNSLWLTNFVAQSGYEHDILRKMIRAVLATRPETHNILLFVKFGEEAEALRLCHNVFHNLPIRDEPKMPPTVSSFDATPKPEGTLWRCRRTAPWCVPPLYVRIAEVEDHDELVDVFDKQSEVITQIYGDYFIAELIEGQNSDNRALVAEVDGRAVGLMCLTSDVDINILSQCFQLEPFDNLVRPQYMDRIRDRLQEIQLRDEGVMESDEEDNDDEGSFEGRTDIPEPAPGDALLAAFKLVEEEEEGGIEKLIERIPRNDEGQISAVSMLQTLQMVDLGEEIADQIDFADSLMLILWQVAFTEPMLDGQSIVEPERVVSAIHTFQKVTLTERKRLGKLLLERWSDVESAYEAVDDTKDTTAAIGDDSPAAAAGGGGEGSPEMLTDAAREGGGGALEDEGGREEEEEDEAEGARILLVLLRLGDKGILTHEEIVHLVAAFHWWGDISILYPISRASLKTLRVTCERLARGEEEYLLLHHGSPMWLTFVPDEEKNAFCINLFGLESTHQAQAVDFLQPAFSLYPTKEYCILTQPTTAPPSPLLAAFSLIPARPTSTFSHALYLLHRSALLHISPPIVRPIAPPDLRELDILTSGLSEDIRDCLFDIAHELLYIPRTKDTERDKDREEEDGNDDGEEGGEEEGEGEDGAAEGGREGRSKNSGSDLAPLEVSGGPGSAGNPHRKMLVVFVEGQLVAILEATRLSAVEIEAYKSHYYVEDFFIPDFYAPSSHIRVDRWLLNPAFQPLIRTILRETLRWMGGSVLYMEQPIDCPAPPVISELIQVAPRHFPTLKKLETGYISGKSKNKNPYVTKEPFANQSPADLKGLLATRSMEFERHQYLKQQAALYYDEESGQATHQLYQHRGASLVPKRLLSDRKLPVTARIVVVGASDAGLSVLESLLSLPHLSFKSLALLAPGGLPYGDTQHSPLLASSGAYNFDDLRLQLFELRVRVLDSRMVSLDRKNGTVGLQDGSQLPYDTLVLAAGLQDDALNAMKIRSWGIETGPTGPFAVREPSPYSQPMGEGHSGATGKASDVPLPEGFRRLNGAISSADPTLRELLIEGGVLMKSLIWNPLSYAVVYGRSLDAYCLVQGLLLRKVPPKKLILVLPPREEDLPATELASRPQLACEAFRRGDAVEQRIHELLSNLGVRVLENFKLCGVQQDPRQRLKGIILEDYNLTLDEARTVAEQLASADAEDKGGSNVPPPSGFGKSAPPPPPQDKKRHGGNQLELLDYDMSVGRVRRTLACRLLVTADARNVDPDVFAAVHSNGLVYDGRLIVDHTFKTTDEKIYGAGSLCEFCRRYRVRRDASLRHDGFNGREIGQRLAESLCRYCDPIYGDQPSLLRQDPRLILQTPRREGAITPGSRAGHRSPRPPSSADAGRLARIGSDELPQFGLPVGRCGLLPGNLHYYHIRGCKPDLNAPVSRELEHQRADGEEEITTDTLKVQLPGHGHKSDRQAEGEGHFCRAAVDKLGRIASLTYIGFEELEMPSLWSLVGLSLAYFNNLKARHATGDIPDLVDFLSEGWATALFHDGFADMWQRLKAEIAQMPEIQAILSKALAPFALPAEPTVETVRPHLPPATLNELRSQFPASCSRAVEDSLLAYLRRHTNHMKDYFLQEQWSQ
ncbi:unnamed protein product [Vitrella brassicaformis CCMP3155]|uniref:Uncharacterized protein n=4 Tax=Vitrella brassicaformis TaxID=1169539 RepID=A0A0G4EVM7_VITBC|nr:unnamed protein product [Vitrella brassicaformis CCMP3155]|eukprot:CEM02697.1 unnamed protein product [Vitrella brassicaformis CCMP3155]